VNLDTIGWRLAGDGRRHRPWPARGEGLARRHGYARRGRLGRHHQPTDPGAPRRAPCPGIGTTGITCSRISTG